MKVTIDLTKKLPLELIHKIALQTRQAPQAKAK